MRGEIHLYLPASIGPHPFVLGIHGGGWQSGDQTSYTWLWPKIAPIGVALVLLSYRLAPRFPFPCAYEDVLRVLSWIRKNGLKHGLDVDRCLLLGGSAGGHIAMLVATRGTSETREIPTIRGVAVFCGIMDLEAQYYMDRQYNRTYTKDFLQQSPVGNREVFRQASPIAHIHAAMPPVWLAHGARDNVASPNQSRNLVRDLLACGHTPIYREAKARGHTMLEADPPENSPISERLLFEDDFLDFLSKTLLL